MNQLESEVVLAVLTSSLDEIQVHDGQLSSSRLERDGTLTIVFDYLLAYESFDRDTDRIWDLKASLFCRNVTSLRVAGQIGNLESFPDDLSSGAFYDSEHNEVEFVKLLNTNDVRSLKFVFCQGAELRAEFHAAELRILEATVKTIAQREIDD